MLRDLDSKNKMCRVIRAGFNWIMNYELWNYVHCVITIRKATPSLRSMEHFLPARVHLKGRLGNWESVLAGRWLQRMNNAVLLLKQEQRSGVLFFHRMARVRRSLNLIKVNRLHWGIIISVRNWRTPSRCATDSQQSCKRPAVDYCTGRNLAPSEVTAGVASAYFGTGCWGRGQLRAKSCQKQGKPADNPSSDFGNYTISSTITAPRIE